MSNQILPTQEFADFYHMSYLELCDALKKKYGEVPEPYFKKSKSGSLYANSRIKRGKEGLEIHHIAENKFLLLSNLNNANSAGLEYQEPKYLVYANKLEHALLHAKIAVEYGKNTDKGHKVGAGGLYSQIMPFLNDLFSGWIPRNKTEFAEAKPFLIKTSKGITFDKQQYMNYILVVQYLNENHHADTRIYSCYNVKSKAWSIKKNMTLFKTFEKLGTPPFTGDDLRRNVGLIKSNITVQNHPERIDTKHSHWARWKSWAVTIPLGLGVIVVLILLTAHVI